MDNLCHTLVGVTLAQSAFKERTGRAVLTGAIAANLPDLDVLVFLTDTPSVAFRRGITHGVPAQILLPLALTATIWWLHRRDRRGALPVRFVPLLALSYLGVLTHVYMDLLNTYGVRLLSPASQQWFYGDSIFIVDIALWLILGAGAALTRWRRVTTWARAAVIVAVLYIAGMVTSARMARTLVVEAWTRSTGTPPHALMVGPRPLSLLRKDVIVDAGDRYYEGTFRWLPTIIHFETTSTPKNTQIPEAIAAREDPRVRAFLLWSRFPFWEVRDTATAREVRLGDMRFKSGPAGRNFRVTLERTNVEGRRSK